MRFQYKVTDGGRIWFSVEPSPKGSKTAGRVLLERCEPGHPKETDVDGRRVFGAEVFQICASSFEVVLDIRYLIPLAGAADLLG